MRPNCRWCSPAAGISGTDLRTSKRYAVANILDEIVAAKRQHVERLRIDRPESAVRDAAEAADPPRDFAARLRQTGKIQLIAEVKKASPSAGVIRPDFDPVAIARTYESHGAACISVLTDAPYFQGSLDDLRQVRSAVTVPVLRKDFILEPYQVYEARAAGADAVLLIAECLNDTELQSLVAEANQLDMTPLVEIYEPGNLPRALDAGAHVVGVNNRNLKTFEVDLEHTLRIRQNIPRECILVGESGIRSLQDVRRLEEAGVDAILVGESLMGSKDIGAAVDALMGR